MLYCDSLINRLKIQPWWTVHVEAVNMSSPPDCSICLEPVSSHSAFTHICCPATATHTVCWHSWVLRQVLLEVPLRCHHCREVIQDASLEDYEFQLEPNSGSFKAQFALLGDSESLPERRLFEISTLEYIHKFIRPKNKADFYTRVIPKLFGVNSVTLYNVSGDNELTSKPKIAVVATDAVSTPSMRHRLAQCVLGSEKIYAANMAYPGLKGNSKMATKALVDYWRIYKAALAVWRFNPLDRRDIWNLTIAQPASIPPRTSSRTVGGELQRHSEPTLQDTSAAPLAITQPQSLQVAATCQAEVYAQLVGTSRSSRSRSIERLLNHLGRIQREEHAETSGADRRHARFFG